MMGERQDKISFTIDREKEYVFLDRKSKKRQYIASLFVSVSAVCAGCVLGWTSPVLPQITEDSDIITQAGDLVITEGEGAIVGSMLAVGAILAAIPAGYLSDKYGRKKVLYMLTFLYTAHFILICVSNNIYLIYFARFIGGAAAGGTTVAVPVYLAEIADDSIRGVLGSFFQVSFCVGILIVNILGIFFTWIELSMFLMIFPIINFFCLFFVPETYLYLLKIGDHTNAKASYQYFNGKDSSVPDDYESHGNIKFSRLIKVNKNVKVLLIGMGLVGCQQLSGVNAVLFYTANIFNAAGTTFSASISSVIVTTAQVIMAIISAALVDKLNRRFYLITSAAGSVISLILLGLYFQLDLLKIQFTGMSYLPIISLVLFIVSFSIGLGPIPWLMMSELFAPEFKGFGCGFVSLFNWFLVFLVTLGFPVICSTLGEHITFYIFAICNLLALLFSVYCVPETKGKSLKEIQDLLK